MSIIIYYRTNHISLYNVNVRTYIPNPVHCVNVDMLQVYIEIY